MRGGPVWAAARSIPILSITHRGEFCPMNLNRKSIWMSLVMGAAIGCAEEEAAGPATPPTEPPRGALASPPPPTKSEPAKGGMTSEMTPPPAKTEPRASEPKQAEPPKVEGPKTESTKPQAAAAKLADDELAEIKKLPAAEQDQAIKQAVCPVSSHSLGSMGMPIKVTAEGRTFFLCCDDCKEKVDKDPKAVIATLDKK
jgi:hypothetical protein